MIRQILAFLLFSTVVTGQTVRYVPRHDELKYTFGGHPAVLRLNPGTILETWTEDCFDGAVKKPGDLPTQVAPIGKDNPQTGPFYIEGAKPGDILAVHIIDIRPARLYAVSSNYPEFGDGHLAQGEGEIIGTALEAALNVTVAIDVIHNKSLYWPRIESDEYLMAIGCYRPLEDAFRIAYKELVLWLADEYGMDTLDAYQLCSQAGVADVAQVVDPNYTVVAKIRKIFLPGASVMKGMHAKMKMLRH